MIADVRVGLLYSGGIDSNLINDICQDDLVKFTGGFEGDYDVMHAKKNEKLSNIIEVSNQDFIERFDKMIKLRKEPLSVPNEVILSFLAGEWSKEEVKFYCLVKLLMSYLQVMIGFTNGHFKNKNLIQRIS